MRALLSAAASLVLATGAHAAEPAPAPVTDPNVVAKYYHTMLQRPEFHLQEEPLGGLRWTDWLSQWMTHLVARLQNFKYAGQMSALAWIFVAALTLLAIAGLAYVLVRLSRRKRDGALDMDDPMPERRALLSPRQYERRLRQALEQKDWHGAWLAAWLQLLARLETRHLVEADRSRTNREYLAQLRGQPLPPAALPLMGRLVEDYDRVIYGLRAIDETAWNAFQQRIDEVTLMLNLRDVRTEEPA